MATFTGDNNPNLLPLLPTDALGDDRLNGLGGNDVIAGYTGNDVLNGGAGGDLLIGGVLNIVATIGTVQTAGNDTADYSDSTGGVTIDLSQVQDLTVNALGLQIGVTNAARGFGGDAEGDILVGISNLTGSSASDTLTGNDAVNVLVGNGGNDTLRGGSGDDTLDGGADFDTAVYSGSRGDFFERGSGTGFIARDLRANSPDGRDTLTNIEKLQFDDGYVTLRINAAGYKIASFDAAGRADFSRLTGYDGSVIFTDFDQDNQFAWSQSIYNYDAQGRIASQNLFYDDGTRLLTVFDQADQFTWTRSLYSYDAQDRIDTQQLFNDDGTRLVTDFDQADAGSWARTIASYDAQNRLDTYLQENDNGTYTVTDFDQADQSNRYSVSYDYTATGQITRTLIVYDDGTGMLT